MVCCASCCIVHNACARVYMHGPAATRHQAHVGLLCPWAATLPEMPTEMEPPGPARGAVYENDGWNELLPWVSLPGVHPLQPARLFGLALVGGGLLEHERGLGLTGGRLPARQ